MELNKGDVMDFLLVLAVGVFIVGFLLVLFRQSD